ncbi:MAG: transglycosylase SLT domain-containing protein [Spirochaetota bacterium]
MTPTTKLLLLIAGVFLLGCSTGDPYVPEEDPVLLRANRRAELRTDVLVVEAERPGSRIYPNIENFLEGPNPALALYREEVTRRRVVDFFVEETGSEATALPILYYADRLDIPLLLAFSLVWGESRYYPVAVNYNSRSIDRGLFQLNSLTFRHLTEDDFFNPEVNTFHGLKYLEFCLNQGRDDAEALAIYNAGLTRVVRGQTPAITLRYVDTILSYREQLVERFEAYILSHFPPAIA